MGFQKMADRAVLLQEESLALLGKLEQDHRSLLTDVHIDLCFF
jgi:hypothetical protein